MILYYFIFGLYLLVAVLFSYYIGISPEMLIDPQSTVGHILQNGVIFYLIAAIPACLYYLRHKPYLQMVIMAVGGLSALVLFYFMGRYSSMLYLSGMALIAHVFTKTNVLANTENQP